MGPRNILAHKKNKTKEILKSFVNLNLFRPRNVIFLHFPQAFDVVFLLVKLMGPPNSNSVGHNFLPGRRHLAT